MISTIKKYLQKRPVISIITVVLVSHFVLTAFAWGVRTNFGYFMGSNSTTTLLRTGETKDTLPLASYWSHFDSAYYEAIATNGYVNDGSDFAVLTSAFFPVYPYILGLIVLVFGSVKIAGLLLGLCISCSVGFAAYKLLIYQKYPHALSAALVLVVLPNMFYLGAALSDGLFLLLSLCGVYCLQRKWFWRAAFFAALLPLTKLLGVLFFIPFVGALYVEYGKTFSIKKYAPCVASGVGGLLVLLHNQVISGDPLHFMNVVSSEWGRTNNIVGIITKPFTSASLALLTIVAVVVLALIVIERKKLGWWWVSWGVLLVVIPLASSPLGQVRYAVANVPLLCALYFLVSKQKKIMQVGFIALSLSGFLLLGLLWMLDHPILQ